MARLSLEESIEKISHEGMIRKIKAPADPEAVKGMAKPL
jgi:hypothetical protein